ncbi:VOC family protein [Mycobacterium arosiense]|nr:VOC family protein [Mycobacterium arosiense]
MGDGSMAELRVSHVGLCVADLTTSLRFYTEGLGFEVAETYGAGEEVAAAAEITGGAQLTSQMITKDGLRLELMWWAEPGCIGAPSTRRNQVGLTHLSFEVDDLPGAEARLVVHGAKVIESTRTCVRNADVGYDLVFLTDPDGNRIELIQWISSAENTDTRSRSAHTSRSARG